MSKKVKTLLLFADGPWATESIEPLLSAGYKITGLVLRTAPSDTSLKRLALKNSIPVFTPEKVNSESFLKKVKNIDPDLAISISYNQIIREKLIAVPREGFINFHAGMLPKYRGRNVVNWAIINGEKEIGLTCHFVDEGIDTGDIVLQAKLPIASEDNYQSILEKLYARFPSFVLESLEQMQSRTFQPEPQGTGGTYYTKRSEGDEEIDWSQTSVQIHNKIRGITKPGPGAQTFYGTDKVFVWKSQLPKDSAPYLATPGQIVSRQGVTLSVKTGDSVIELIEYESEIRANIRVGERFQSFAAAKIQILEERITQLEKTIEGITSEFENYSKARHKRA